MEALDYQLMYTYSLVVSQVCYSLLVNLVSYSLLQSPSKRSLLLPECQLA